MDMYFSLVVRADESQCMPDSRMFEETDQDVISRFTRDNAPDLEALSNYPVILTKEFQEGDTSTMAVIGYMDCPSMNPRISRPVLRFPASVLVERGMLSGGWKGSRTRWKVSRGDPYRQLAGIVEGPATAEGAVKINEQQVAVMMPFRDDPQIDPVYGAMKQGAKDVGLQCVRVDQLVVPGDITEDIRRLIVESRVVIADLTGVNPNVVYELGFAHGHDKKVIMVSGDLPDRLPFDIRPQRVLFYQRDKAGLNDLKWKITEALKGII